MKYSYEKTEPKAKFKLSTNKKLLIGIILSAVSIILGISQHSKPYPYSGVVLNKEGESMAITGGKRQRLYVERYVTIKFDNGHIKSINLEPTSYYTTKNGQKITLLLTKSEFDQENPLWLFLIFSGIISLIGLCVWAFIRLTEF